MRAIILAYTGSNYEGKNPANILQIKVRFFRLMSAQGHSQ